VTDDDAMTDLRRIATENDVDPDGAARVASELAEDRGDTIELLAAALGQQLEAGVGLDAAVSALRAADRGA
jgi:hypothetical protein